MGTNIDARSNSAAVLADFDGVPDAQNRSKNNDAARLLASAQSATAATSCHA